MSLLEPLRKLLSQPVINRIRRNHGLEHATIHVLSARYPNLAIAGRADPRGYLILGKLPTDAVTAAAQEALRRLKAGEHHLAVHPNCGTNFLTAGLLAGAASYFSLLGGNSHRWRDRLGRLPFAIMAAILALIISQPLGAAAQRHLTTESDVGALEILNVRRLHRGRTIIHRIRTHR